MAQTTLATSMSLIKDKYLARLVLEYFVKPDPAIARIPMMTPGSANGYQWKQQYVNDAAAATAFKHWDTFAATAFTVAEYNAFLSGIQKMDQRNRALSALGEGTDGKQDRNTKKTIIIRELAKLYREYVFTGEPVTVAIGATVQGTFGANVAVELGPRCVDFDDVHQVAAGTSTTVGLLKWTLIGTTVSYMAPGDTAYGPEVVISGSNYHRVPLFSGGGTTGSVNSPKWIRLSIAQAELAALLVSANFTPNAAVPAQVLTFSPTGQSTGFLRQVSPRQEIYHDLTGAAAANGTTAVGNGPAAGGSLNRENLTWMKQRLLDASNGDPSRCAVFMSDNLLNRAEGIIASLGGGINPVMFMGSELNALSYGGIPFLRNQWLATDLDSRDGTRDDLTYALGACFGTENAHVKYNTLSPDVINDSFSDYTAGMAVAQGDGTPTGSLIPLTYWETPYASDRLIVNQIGHMLFEPVAQLQDLVKVTHLFNG